MLFQSLHSVQRTASEISTSSTKINMTINKRKISEKSCANLAKDADGVPYVDDLSKQADLHRDFHQSLLLADC